MCRHIYKSTSFSGSIYWYVQVCSGNNVAISSHEYLLKTPICNYFSDNIPEIQTCVTVVVAQWCSGAVVQWRSGAVAQWCAVRASDSRLREPGFES